MNVETVNRIEAHANSRLDTILAVVAAVLSGEKEAGIRSEDFGPILVPFTERVTPPVTVVREVQSSYGNDVEPGEHEDVSGYERFSIPVIAEGDASPEGVFWSDEGVKLIEAEEWMSRPNDPAVKDPRCYGVKVRGDSMEPLLEAGMRVIVSPNLSVTSKGLGYVQLRNGERLIKMVHVQPGGYTLESFNRAYAPRFVAREEVDAVHRIAYIRTLK